MRDRATPQAARRRPALAVLAGLAAVGLAVPAAFWSAAPSGADASSAVSVTSTVTRTTVAGGSSQVIDSRAVTFNVSQTANLQGRQEVSVSWSGAHPTGGLVANQNSAQAQYEEYPFVLLECRGTDSTSVAPADQLTPQTCWTQTWTERYQDSLDDPYPPYRLDQAASPAGQPVVGAPASLPASCAGDENAAVQYWVPFDAAGGQVYPGGNAGCAGEAPESNDVGGGALPSNETFGVTDTNGQGSANFDVFTSQQNASLGCTENVPCALVAVPIMGISCDPSVTTSPAPSAADVSACEATGAYAPGANAHTGAYENGADLAVTGSLWWSPSNWRNHITVPLTFAPPPDACSLTGSSSKKVIDIYGSESMIQATSQWDPRFCLSSQDNFTVNQVQTGEPESRNLLATGGAEAAFTSYAQSGGYGRPVVNAPVALTGFSVSYDIDGADGQPYPSLKLTPRLLAKLLTESYPGELFLKQEDTALGQNPLNITEDPEFQALNPGITPIAIPGAISEAASELIALSSQSDVIEALTSYINDDPAARAWLNGTPDQWGMAVNPAYKGMSLPVNEWPLLSTFQPTNYYQTDNNDCLYNNPLAYQPLIAAPLASLEDISLGMQYAKPNSTTQCFQPNPGSSVGEKLTTDGQQTPGNRFMIGITPLADNQRYLIQSAALQTTTGTFVAPDTQSLTAAASLLQPDRSTGTWPIPYAEFGQSVGAAAYPGTLVVYAAIPTSGLPPTDAQEYGTFLNVAATTGQTQGSGVGQLPPGYLPLTDANHLGALASYTQAAAVDVAAQNGQLPSLTSSTGSQPAAAAQATSSTPLTGAGPGSGSSAGFTSSGFGLGAMSLGRVHANGPAAAPAHRSAKPAIIEMLSSLLAPAKALWTAGFPALLVFGLGMFGLLAVPLTYRLGRKRGRW